MSKENKERISLKRDESSFKEYFLANYTFLKNNASSFLHDKQLSEDVASEILWKVWHLGPDLMKIGCVESYILRSIKNKCLNILRVKQLIYIDIYDYQEGLIEKNTPEKLFISSEAIQRIHFAINNLPPQTKRAFKLIKEEKKTYMEAAQIMGISKKTIDRHIQIALQKLWKNLKEK